MLRRLSDLAGSMQRIPAALAMHTCMRICICINQVHSWKVNQPSNVRGQCSPICKFIKCALLRTS